ncbi:MAG: MBL fold metallo-hydrolase [Patescibacteria group bacterium]|nr:MBL fold metallo-hydrolase [Patescibacteria group bacterium]
MKRIVAIGLTLVISLVGFIFYDYSRFYDGRLHLVFCNVGQGDAIFLRTPGERNILIDAGPNDKVVSCLTRHTPFWDRKISLVLLTHPHADHFMGLSEILKRYDVLSFATEKLENKTLGYKVLMKEVSDKVPKHSYVYAGDSFREENGLRFAILAPTSSFLLKTSPNNMIGENSEFGSLITLVSYGSFKALLTGDSQKEELMDAISSFKLTSVGILQVPHHGSKTGISKEILETLNPGTAVISVGLNNRYGHPNPYTLSLLKDSGVKTLRTDINGEIEVISDGKTFGIRESN